MCVCTRVYSALSRLAPGALRAAGSNSPATVWPNLLPSRTRRLGRPAVALGLVKKPGPPRARENRPGLGKSLPPLTRAQEAGFPDAHAAGRSEGRDSTSRGSPLIPWVLNTSTPGPRRPISRPQANFSRSPKARKLRAIEVPEAKWAQSLGQARSPCSPPRSGGRDAGPQPRQPTFSSRKPGPASGAGTSAPAKGEVEVERGA